jgi:RNA polymerase sigma-70 factor, ECF subfamily
MSYQILVSEPAGTLMSDVLSTTLHRLQPAPTTERPTPTFSRWTMGSRQGNAALMAELPEMLQAAQAGDDQAFGLLITHYQQMAKRVAQQILRTEEAAADAVQEAMIKVYRALPRFQEGNFRSWLLRIVTNTCYDHLRRQKRRRALSLDELTEGSDTEASLGERAQDIVEDPETMALQRERMHLLMTAIDDLPAWHRTVVLLIDVHGLDYEEASEQLGVPLGTVKSRLSRARSALRDRLVRDGLAPGQLQ